MIFGYFTLLVALVISAVAEYYSIVGLTAIFSAAFWPIVIMGAVLGVGKITAAVWLKLNWDRASWTYKLYLVPAVAFLMVLTSMGIFGFLSKAHSDQSLVSGDSQAKVAIYDEKIKTAKDNIDANRKVLKQMDEAVDQSMARSTDEKGADKAVAIRRGQLKERQRLQSEIAAEQKTINQLSEERAPLAAEFRKVESEVGPIKYIAALIYGDNPDANILEKAVRLVIMMIVAVFDPLALVLILAAQQSLRWAKDEKDEPTPVEVNKHTQPSGSGLTIDEQIAEADAASDDTEHTAQPVPDEPQTIDGPPEPEVDKYAYLKQPFVHFTNLTPMVATSPEPVVEAIEDEPVVDNFTEQDLVQEEPKILAMGIDDVERPGDYITPPEVTYIPNSDHLVHEGKSYSIESFKEHYPEFSAIADNHPSLGNASRADFGNSFPLKPVKGDLFLRTDYLPGKLFKWNGTKWLEVDKSFTDSYAYNDEYIRHLVEKVGSGEYDIDDLTEAEQTQMTEYLKNNTKS